MGLLPSLDFLSSSKGAGLILHLLLLSCRQFILYPDMVSQAFAHASRNADFFFANAHPVVKMVVTWALYRYPAPARIGR